jgi:hypothetical protein
MKTIYVETDEKQALLMLPGMFAKTAFLEIAVDMHGKPVLNAGLELASSRSFSVFIRWFAPTGCKFHMGFTMLGFHFHRAWLELSKRIGQMAEVVAL